MLLGLEPNTIRVARRMAICALVVVCALCLCLLPGCKYSDVLTQHTEDPDIGELDENVEPIYESSPDAPPRPDLVDVSIGDSDDENTQARVLPHYDPDAPDNGPTPRRIKSPETPHEEQVTESTEASEEPEVSGEGEQEEGAEPSSESEEEDEDEEEPNEGDNGEAEESEEPPDDGGNNEGDDEGEGDPLGDGEESDPDLTTEGGGGGNTVNVDPEGTNSEVAKGTVAAVGEYATIAQMLGGAGALAASDAEWLAARETDGAFAGELERVEVAFSGDGTEGGSCDVELLIDTVKPSVVLWDGNAPALSDSERSALEGAGITVQPVPRLGEQTTEDYEIRAAVQEVASVLEGASELQFDPQDVCNKYLGFHDETLVNCYNANDGFSYKVCDSQYPNLYQETPLSGLDNSTTTRIATAYVESVMRPSTSSLTIAQAATTSEGVIRLAHDGQTVDVSDGVGLSATTNTSRYMLLDYYLQLAGVMNNAYDTDRPESQGRAYFVMPGSTDAFGKSSAYASRSTASALFYNSGDGSVAANWHVLGNADFPAVLAADQEVADMFVSSAAKADGLYRMESQYRVIVVPTGIAGRWSEGHIDSFLLAPWAFRIGNEDNLGAAAGYAEKLYRDFLRCDNWESAIADWNNVAVAG